MKSKAFDHSKYPNWIDPETVLPYERNAKQHTEKQIKNLVNSINRFGWQQDVVITSDNVLVIGHGRRLAAMQIGCELPYHVIDKNSDELTDEDIRELRIADNQTNAETGMDWDTLEAEIYDLSFDGFDFDFGFDFDDEEEPAEIVEDEVPEEVETRCKLGDVWRLGNHRLICGDCTDPAVIDRLMDGVKANLVLTDPPYGTTAVEWDCDIDLEKMWAVVIAHSQGDSAILIFTAQPFTTTVINSNAKNFRYEIIWVKTQKTGFYNANRMPLKAHENILVFYSKLPTFNPQKTKVERNDVGRVRNKKADRCVLYGHVEAQDYIEDGTRYPADVIEFSNWNGALFGNNDNATVHPTQKPIELLSYLIKTYSNEDDTVMDIFGGSGSTLIACEQLNRKCYMCEIDPHYCDVIIQRWENLTGETAALFNV